MTPYIVRYAGSGGPSSFFSSQVAGGFSLAAPNCGILSTDAIVPASPGYKNFTPPAVNSTYNDGGGYCTVKRITNHGGQMTPFYSIGQAISAGNTKILGFDGYNAHYWIWDFNGNNVISGSAFDTAANENGGEVRWDRFDDSVIWVCSGSTIRKCTITMGTPGSMSCVDSHTFSEYSQGVVFPADSAMNENGWVPMVGQNVAAGQVEIFMFQPSTNTKAGIYAPPSCTGAINTNEPGCIHRLIATPDNGMTTEGIGTGQMLWQPPFSGAPTSWNPSSDHHDVGYNVDGTTKVGLFEDFDNSNTGGPGDFRPQVLNFSSTTTPGNTPLTPTGATNPPPSFGWHVNYNDHQTRPWVAWTMMSNATGPEFLNSDASYADPVAWNQSGGNWYPMQGEVILTRVDSNVTSIGQATTKIYRLALHHARQNPAGTGAYWADVFANLSWDGKYVVFGSNSAYAASGCPVAVNNDCSDLYLIGPLF